MLAGQGQSGVDRVEHVRFVGYGAAQQVDGHHPDVADDGAARQRLLVPDQRRHRPDRVERHRTRPVDVPVGRVAVAGHDGGEHRGGAAGQSAEPGQRGGELRWRRLRQPGQHHRRAGQRTGVADGVVDVVGGGPGGIDAGPTAPLPDREAQVLVGDRHRPAQRGGARIQLLSPPEGGSGRLLVVPLHRLADVVEHPGQLRERPPPLGVQGPQR
ncbi:hypothetical protein C1A38_24450 [Verrucosispora sp. ts21]|nr:hypothetical protein C1A38_24450 [Verrucosispora sp. ts21]